MKIDLKALRALCDAATDGPWETNYTGNVWGDIDNPEHDGDSPLLAQIFKGGDEHLDENQTANARFIAATDPQTVRALIDDIERYRAALEAVKKGILSVAVAGHTSKCCWGDNESPDYDEDYGYNPNFKCTCGAENLDVKQITETIVAALEQLTKTPENVSKPKTSNAGRSEG